MPTRCEFEYRIKEWPYTRRCKNDATHFGTADGARVEICEGHTHFVQNPEALRVR